MADLDRHLLATMDKRVCARIVRDLALDVVSATNIELESPYPDFRVFEAQSNDVLIMLRTRSGTYGLEIWQGKKVFIAQWGPLDHIEIIGFKRGPWELRLVEWAAQRPPTAPST